MLKLPVDEFIPEIERILKSGSHLVITASPGAGKTTRIPACLTKVFKKKILVLEPRRMAAIAASHRISEEQKWELGDQVGYVVRFDRKVKVDTKLVFLTESLLARMMIEDPELKDVDCIVLDEFHERNMHVDLALGLLKELQELGRTIQLVVMSATLDASQVANYLGPGTPILEIPGNLQPLQINYETKPQNLKTDQLFFEKLATKIKEIAIRPGRDILVFLPGIGEIERTAEIIHPWCDKQNIHVVPLHGSLDVHEQKDVLKSKTYRRIILSTNIAESSVTIDGVDTVIDTGLEKSLRFDSNTGFSRLELGRISKASATQRAGRSARQYPGTAHRMWSKLDEMSFPEANPADIQRHDLSEAVLYLAKQGIRNFESFCWFESPPTKNLKSAINELIAIGALDQNHEITALGKRMVKLPLHPRLSLLLLIAEDQKSISTGAAIAAVLQEKDFIQPRQVQAYLGDQIECDMELRLMEIKNQKTILKSAQQLAGLCGQAFHIDEINTEKVKSIVLRAFPDRLCRRRGTTERALMVGGRGVMVDSQSLVKKSEFFIALRAQDKDQESLVRIATGMNKSFILNELKSEITQQNDFFFNEEKGQIYERNFKSFRGLPLEEPTLKIPSKEIIQEHLPDICVAQIQNILKQNEELQNWKTRMKFLDQDFNFFDQEFLKSIFEQAAIGESDLTSVIKKDLVYFFENEIGQAKSQELKSQVPAKLTMPSGSNLKVHYPDPASGQSPYVEVRIQEVFGLTETPKVKGGQAIAFHLLAPNYRPMQVTSDLKSFWQNGYPEVKKELRSRYPKHSWPDDPLTAPAVAKGRPRG